MLRSLARREGEERSGSRLLKACMKSAQERALGSVFLESSSCGQRRRNPEVWWRNRLIARLPPRCAVAQRDTAVPQHEVAEPPRSPPTNSAFQTPYVGYIGSCFRLCGRVPAQDPEIAKISGLTNPGRAVTAASQALHRSRNWVLIPENPRRAAELPCPSVPPAPNTTPMNPQGCFRKPHRYDVTYDRHRVWKNAERGPAVAQLT